MPFYRYKDPTYGLLGGAFPGAIGGVTYGRLNVTSEGQGGGDGSAIVSPAKVGAPNAGTLMVAFGEHGVSSHVNRGLAALGYNTDVLDDVVRSNVPFPTYVDGTTGGVSATIAITGDVWTGSATDDVTLAVAGLASVEDPSTGRALQDASGNIITIQSIEQPVSTVRLRDGFVTNPVIRFSSSIPASTDYRIRFYKRTSLANMAQTNPSAWVAWVMELQGVVMKNAYNVLQGLDEKYRRASVVPIGALADTPGDGAVVVRDGRSVGVVPPATNNTPTPTTTPQADPFLACFTHELDGGAFNVGAWDRDYAGDIGFLSLSSFRTNESDVGELSQRGRALASHASLNVRSVVGSVGGDPAYTQLEKGQAALGGPGGDTDAISVASGHFRSGGNTAIRLGYDMLVVDRATGSTAVVIQEILTDTSVRVTTPGGQSPVFTTNEVVNITWVQPVVTVGGGMANGVTDDPNWSPMGLLYPTRLSDSDANDSKLPDAEWVGERSNRRVLHVGYHDYATGEVVSGVEHYANGSIDMRDVTSYLRGGYAPRAYVPGPLTGSGAIEVQVDGGVGLDTGENADGAGFIRLAIGPGAGNSFTVELTSEGILSGRTTDILILVTDDGEIVLDGGASFVFSGNDGVIPEDSNGRAFLFHGVSLLGTWYMTRTDY